MVNGALHFYVCSRDFGFEQRDALLKLLHRQGIEILSAELGRKIVLAARKILVCVHRGPNVDRWRADVNKRGLLSSWKATSR